MGLSLRRRPWRRYTYQRRIGVVAQKAHATWRALLATAPLYARAFSPTTVALDKRVWEMI